jgi:hypothetical protein
MLKLDFRVHLHPQNLALTSTSAISNFNVEVKV